MKLAQIDYQGIYGPVGSIAKKPLLGTNNIFSIVINELIPYVLVFSGILLILLIINAGIDWMTAGGDPKKIDSAKSKFTSSLVGFCLIFSAYWIYQIVRLIFGFLY